MPSSLLIGMGCVLSGFSLACSEQVEVGYNQLSTGGSAGAASGGAGTGGAGTGGAGGLTGQAGAPEGTGGESHSCETRSCGSGTGGQSKQVYACGNCKDDDQDGLVDAEDPDCLGSCDDSEEAFYAGIHGTSGGGCRQDCYFDQDSGSGNDNCDWSFACDPKSQSPNYPPTGNAQCAYDTKTSVMGRSCEALQSSQPQECLDYCGPITPNGCDCFGCCEIPARSGKYVWIGATKDGKGTCGSESVKDSATYAETCPACTPVEACLNKCEECEVCAGETEPPASCSGGSTKQCQVGIGACGPGASCAPDYYCITGCCVGVPR